MKLTETRPTVPPRRHNLLKSWAPPLLAACSLAASCFQANAQTYYLTNNIWALPGAIQNLDTANDNRGMCYYAPSNMVIVNNKSTHLIETYDGTLGTSNGFVNNSGLSGGTFTLNKIGSSSDGVLYGASLTTSIAAGTYKLYQWTDISMAPNVAYSSASGDALVANLSGKRVGDTWAITGGGTNTMILACINTLNEYVLLSTVDAVNFTPTVLTVPAGLPTPGSGVQVGIAFYTNNTFMINPNASGGSGDLYLVQFPTNFASLTSPVTATVLATDTGVGGDWLDLSYNAAAGLLATHANATTAITLYSLPANNFAAIALLATGATSFTTSQSINGNETGDVALGGAALTNAIYTLETSAGLQATAINFIAAPVPPTISAPPVGATTYTNAGSFTFSVSATGTQPLSYLWQYNTVSNQATASDVPGATNSSYTINPDHQCLGLVRCDHYQCRRRHFQRPGAIDRPSSDRQPPRHPTLVCGPRRDGLSLSRFHQL